MRSGRAIVVQPWVGVLTPRRGDTAWRWFFLGGLLLAGIAAVRVDPALVGASPRSLGILAVAGLLVGSGTRLSRGCTSGHGVCGIGRFSKRSMVAVPVFMVTAAITVAIARGLA